MGGKEVSIEINVEYLNGDDIGIICYIFSIIKYKYVKLTYGRTHTKYHTINSSAQPLLLKLRNLVQKKQSQNSIASLQPSGCTIEIATSQSQVSKIQLGTPTTTS